MVAVRSLPQEGDAERLLVQLRSSAHSGAAQALPMSFGGPRPQYEYDVLVGAFARRPAIAAGDLYS